MELASSDSSGAFSLVASSDSPGLGLAGNQSNDDSSDSHESDASSGMGLANDSGSCSAMELASDPGSDSSRDCDEGIVMSARPRRGKLAPAFRFFVLVGVLHGMFGFQELSESLIAGPGRIGTHFSGVGSVEVAVCMLQPALHAFLGGAPALEVASMCEKRRHSQALLAGRSRTACRFWNLMEYCPGLPSMDDLAALPFATRFEVVQNHFQLLRRRCDCHGVFCKAREVDGDIAGSPCQPWSRAGSQKGRGLLSCSIYIAAMFARFNRLNNGYCFCLAGLDFSARLV